MSKHPCPRAILHYSMGYEVQGCIIVTRRLSRGRPGQPAKTNCLQGQPTHKSLIYMRCRMNLPTLCNLCKAIDRDIQMTYIHVVEKHGGKPGNGKVE